MLVSAQPWALLQKAGIHYIIFQIWTDIKTLANLCLLILYMITEKNWTSYTKQLRITHYQVVQKKNENITQPMRINLEILLCNVYYYRSSIYKIWKGQIFYFYFINDLDLRILYKINEIHRLNRIIVWCWKKKIWTKVIRHIPALSLSTDIFKQSCFTLDLE